MGDAFSSGSGRGGQSGGAILLRRLTVSFPGRPRAPALQAVSARILPGVTWLVGPSGAGKSTLLRVLATLLR
ncbi:MAG: ATP-binding cassette domain-containing protein, partial [Bacillota bacterium]|nr:ATP-binding cassette domain-containing protein [Bacillota bacterium]